MTWWPHSNVGVRTKLPPTMALVAVTRGVSGLPIAANATVVPSMLCVSLPTMTEQRYRWAEWKLTPTRILKLAHKIAERRRVGVGLPTWVPRGSTGAPRLLSSPVPLHLARERGRPIAPRGRTAGLDVDFHRVDAGRQHGERGEILPSRAVLRQRNGVTAEVRGFNASGVVPLTN